MGIYFGDFDHSCLLAIMVLESHQGKLSQIFFFQRMKLHVGLINSIGRVIKPEQYKWDI